LDDLPLPLEEDKGMKTSAPFDREERSPVDVRALLNGAREATLILDGEAYRLRITAKEKLILTK
jgi:hemin uptake protein HemP